MFYDSPRPRSSVLEEILRTPPPKCPQQTSFWPEKKAAYSIPRPLRLFCGKDTSVILWEDGTRTVCHVGEGETFDRYTGFMACVCKKMFGSTSKAKKLMERIAESSERPKKEGANSKEKPSKSNPDAADGFASLLNAIFNEPRHV